ncbi:MAG: STAS domain-containing protein [Pseudomonadota bacterium]
MEENNTEKKSSSIGIARVGGHMILTPRGSLTYYNSDDFQVACMTLIEQGQVNVIVDCKSISFWDSLALEALWRVHSVLADRGTSLKLVSLNPVCKDILIATRLINLFLVYNDIPEAIRAKA